VKGWKERRKVLLSMNMVEFGIFTPPRGLEWIYRTAELAETGNWSSVWMPDHLVGWGRKLDAIDPWTTLAAISMRTKRISLGIGVTDPHRRHPAIFAHQAMTIDLISGGRFICGIGAGEAMNLAPYGIDFKSSGKKLEEFLKVVRGLLKRHSFTHEGKFYRLKNAFILPKPSMLKIWVAGNSPRTMRITAEYGDGWLPFKRSPDNYKRDLELIREIAVEKGRNPDDIVPGFLLYTAVSKERKHAEEIVRKEGRILLLVSPRRLKELGYEPPTWKLDAHHSWGMEVAQEIKKVKDVPLEAVEKSFVYGTPDDCIDGIEGYVRAGCRYFVVGLLNPGPERDEAIRIYSEEIIPHF
jgi:alkanesulfonate monooxygenase SsuD/methylene tetrahydromethanopterin reductase-like flavin-dependent oxidoreductase (luciferase family)